MLEDYYFGNDDAVAGFFWDLTEETVYDIDNSYPAKCIKQPAAPEDGSG